MGNDGTECANVQDIQLLLSTRFLRGWDATSLDVLGRCECRDICSFHCKHDKTDDGTACRHYAGAMPTHRLNY